MNREAKISGKPRARGTASAAASALSPAEEAADREFREWIRRYEPVERAIYAERERREASKRRRARERLKAFGDLCEATEGLAAFADRNGITLEEARRRLRRDRPFHPALALPGLLVEDVWTGLAAMRRLLTRRIDLAKHEAVRPAYYAQERARRQALAAERRKVRMRLTLSPCPARLEILDAWTKVKDSPEALLRFGSLMEDLECYVDNGLRRTDDGVIVGRRPGIKGWLQLEIPALYMKYKTVMAYKAAAKRMRQVLDIRDPLPLSAALPQGGGMQDHGADEIHGRASGEPVAGDGDPGTASAKSMTDNAMEPHGGGMKAGLPRDSGARAAAGETGAPKSDAPRAKLDEADELEALRARAVCAEVLDGIGDGHGMTTALMRRLGDLTDPERVVDANMLAGWREKYRRKITVRTKSMWGRRLRLTG